MSMGDAGRYIGDVWYQNKRSMNEAYHRISHGNVSPPDQEYYYLHPDPEGKDVVIYVFERTMTLFDIYDDSAKRIRTLSWDKNTSTWNAKISRWENVPSKHWDKYNPGKDDEGDDHGAKVLDLLTGMTVGAARAATVYVVGRALDIFGVADWEGSFKAVAKHFEDLRARNPKVQGLINMSVGVSNTADRKYALERCIKAGIIIVGAGGNESASLDDPASAADYLPEAIKDDVIIVGSLDANNQIAKISNHGERVDYWVRGTNLRVAKKRIGPAEILKDSNYSAETGTSFSAPILTGVIACMLSAGQVATRLVDNVQRNTIEDVRKRLDEWAFVTTQEVKQVGGNQEKVTVTLKHLRNMPGLVT